MAPIEHRGGTLPATKGQREQLRGQRPRLVRQSEKARQREQQPNAHQTHGQHHPRPPKAPDTALHSSKETTPSPPRHTRRRSPAGTCPAPPAPPHHSRAHTHAPPVPRPGKTGLTAPPGALTAPRLLIQFDAGQAVRACSITSPPAYAQWTRFRST